MMQAEMKGGPIDGQKVTLGDNETYYLLDELVNGKVVTWRLDVVRYRKGPVLIWNNRRRV